MCKICWKYKVALKVLAFWQKDRVTGSYPVWRNYGRGDRRLFPAQSIDQCVNQLCDNIDGVCDMIVLLFDDSINWAQ